jgi:type III pantothenate kinase
MIPSLVVDVGNSRIKWGLCVHPPRESGRVSQYQSLPADDPSTWAKQLERWSLKGRLSWAVSGVHPARRDRFVEWIRQRGDRVALVDESRHLPLDIRLEHPDRVGIDRLLDAVAAKRRHGGSAVIVDAGSAVTVDWLDDAGAFAGGAIFPGLRLMIQALHDYTALLPAIEVPDGTPLVPGMSTPAAMQAGIFWSVVGGVKALTDQLSAQSSTKPALFLTGGDAALLHQALGSIYTLWPEMTLEGIRIAAEALP